MNSKQRDEQLDMLKEEIALLRLKDSDNTQLIHRLRTENTGLKEGQKDMHKCIVDADTELNTLREAVKYFLTWRNSGYKESALERLRDAYEGSTQEEEEEAKREAQAEPAKLQTRLAGAKAESAAERATGFGGFEDE